MNTQPRAQREDPLPSKWNTRWYRFRLRLYRLSARLLRMPRPHDVNVALKNDYWRGFHDAREHYLDHCPVHPEELMLPTGWGYRKCCLCWGEEYFKTLDPGPITDPHQHQIRDLHFPGRPLASFNQALAHGAGPHTAATSAIPRRTKRLDSPDRDRSGHE